MRIALCQFPVENRISRSVFEDKVEKYFVRAKEGDAELLVFPELFVLDRVDRIDTQRDSAALQDLAEEMPDFIAFLKSLSRMYSLAILAGSVPWKLEEKMVNRSFFLGPEGEEFFQDKIYLTPDEKAWGWLGGDELNPFNFRGQKCQILICYDMQFASLSQLVATEGVDVLFCPSLTDAYGRERVAIGCQARSIENFSYTVVTGATGGKSGLYRSRAAVYSPRNEFFSPPLEADAEDLFFADLDFSKLKSAKKSAGIFSGRDSLERSRPVTLRIR